MKIKGPRIAIAACALLIVLFIAFEFQACFYTHGFARSRAFRRVQQLCAQDHRDPGLLSPARDTSVVGAPWAFEWTYEGKPRYLYGIWISRAGDLTFYGGDPDDPASAAYHPK